jgi:hypothetical protein
VALGFSVSPLPGPPPAFASEDVGSSLGAVEISGSATLGMGALVADAVLDAFVARVALPAVVPDVGAAVLVTAELGSVLALGAGALVVELDAASVPVPAAVALVDPVSASLSLPQPVNANAAAARAQSGARRSRLNIDAGCVRGIQNSSRDKARVTPGPEPAESVPALL